MQSQWMVFTKTQYTTYTRTRCHVHGIYLPAKHSPVERAHPYQAFQAPCTLRSSALAFRETFTRCFSSAAVGVAPAACPAGPAVPFFFRPDPREPRRALAGAVDVVPMVSLMVEVLEALAYMFGLRILTKVFWSGFNTTWIGLQL